ncbi:TFIIH p62 subunit protein [Opisthorchis viverrini]|uniref:TFIIH p62 subunit protein n=1 Tax=Opisthorchis viverrini TaxID=6198 RepID=A0A1S8WL12_OPIVI|nr:TFIIH p62 subunit protein [Opisthorchis viverrini]
MSKQKEDVLLMVKHVRYKKVDGTLYVNSGRVAWRNQTSDSFKISAAFEDIRVQRISPDQKEKVQLQLLMHNGESFTFQFADPAGRQKQLEMRNSVKEMLQGLLPKFKDKAHSELKEKFRLLESNPEILALYKELVVTGILSSEEFWTRPEFVTLTPKSSSFDGVAPGSQRKSDSRVTQNTSNHAQTAPDTSSSTTGQISRSFNLADKPQALGVPSNLLSDIKPEADGVNGIKYNLTHDTIDAIFRAYPTVRQRHRELVPDKLSEADFWVKFFQSHYFHRDRVQIPKEDIFAECANLDERHFQNELRRSRRNRISACLDLENLSDHDLGSGYGSECVSTSSAPNTLNSADMPKAADGTKTPSSQSSNYSANQLLLRRFNNHSLLVLKSLGAGDIASGLSCSTSVAESSGHLGASQESPSTVMSTSLKERVYGPELADTPPQPHYPLELAGVSDYLEGPVSIDQSITEHSSTVHPPKQPSFSFSPSQLMRGLKRCQTSVTAAYQSKRKPHAPVVTTLDAQLALVDVSPGGCLVGGKGVPDELKSSRTDRTETNETVGCRVPLDASHPTRNPSSTPGQARATPSTGNDMDRSPAMLNSEQLRELALLYASASELLRHFWACFPVTNQQLVEKLERIATSLTRFRTTKVVHFAASLDSSSGKPDSSLPSHNSDGGLSRDEPQGTSPKSPVRPVIIPDACRLPHESRRCSAAACKQSSFSGHMISITGED